MDIRNPQAPFKIQKKEYGLALPARPEDLRARWRILAVCFTFLRLRHPQRACLRTADVALFDRYTEWMFGDQVWGLVTKDHTGKIVATPHIGVILGYDPAIRTEVAKLMNQGVDITKAFDLVTKSEIFMRISFLNVYSVKVGQHLCQMCTAPVLAEAHGAAALKPLEDVQKPDPKKPPAEKKTAGAGLSKSAKKKAAKAKKNAKAEAEAAAVRKKTKAQLALQNGGVGDDRRPPKGKGKGKVKTITDDGVQICFNYNNGSCTRADRPRAHVCQLCGGKHPRTDPNCPKRINGGA